MNREVIALVENKLYQLPNPFELNGYVASHPPDKRGYAPLNAYLLTNGRRALLLDTGFSVHEESIIEQLESIIDPSVPLEIFTTSIGEFSSICNVKPITDAFNVTKYYGIINGANTWLDFRPEHAPYGTPTGGGSMSSVETGIVKSSDAIDWGDDRSRLLEVFPPPIRLLPTHWAYDPATGTLFTNDSFSHVWRETSDGPWTLMKREDPPEFDDVYGTLVGGRYWWLPGADTARLREDLTDVFDRYEVKIIAPKFGCSITDPDAIAAAYALWTEVLDKAGNDSPPDASVGTGRMGGETK